MNRFSQLRMLERSNLSLQIQTLRKRLGRVPFAPNSEFSLLKFQGNFGLIPLQNKVRKTIRKNPSGLRRRAVPVELRFMFRVPDVRVSSPSECGLAPNGKSKICVDYRDSDVLSFVSTIQMLHELSVSVNLNAPLAVDVRCESSPINVSRHKEILSLKGRN